MKITILGTGDLTKIIRHTKITESELNKLIKEIAILIAKKDHELVIIPDRGIPTEVAKIYKENNGKKVYGVIPKKDKKYGIEHLKQYLYLIDQEIPVDSWYDADGEIASLSDITITIGMSPGIMREITVLKYHYKFLKSKTKLIIFRNTISQEIPKEISEEIPVIYVNSLKELEKFL